MDLTSAMEKLEELGTEEVRARYVKRGAGDRLQFGVMLGQVRKVAKEIKANHELALELWATCNIDAQLLGILLLKPRELSPHELDTMVREADFVQVADWLDAYVIRKHPAKEELRRKWLTDNHPWAARAGWSLTAERIGKDSAELDLGGLLDRIESELAVSAPEVQWTMNNSLAGIGIHHVQHRERAIAIGEELGIYRDYPTPKGCTSPFAPIWIGEMVRRSQ